jgi:hypothetical protein
MGGPGSGRKKGSAGSKHPGKSNNIVLMQRSQLNHAKKMGKNILYEKNKLTKIKNTYLKSNKSK